MKPRRGTAPDEASPGPGRIESGFRARVTAAEIEAALAEGETAAVETAVEALLVSADGTWFCLPGGETVSLARWRPLQRVLAALAEQRDLSPGIPMTAPDLVASGWPGERMLARAGATRVYTAIATLRRLGLRDLLVRDGGGYLLDGDVPLVRVWEP